MRFDIDLQFSVQSPGDPTTGAERASGTVQAAGKTITIATDSLSILPSAGKIDRRALNDLALKLKDLGLVLVINGPNGTVLSLGEVKPGLVSRLGTSSTAIRLGRPGAYRQLRSRGAGRPARSLLAIPGTMFPLVPTIRRTYRRSATTTHYARGGGAPRLIYVKDSETWNGVAPHVVPIPEEGLAIGSAPGCGLALAGLDAAHARIVHNDLDEYVLVADGRVGGSAGLGPGDKYTLRSGARIELGDWRIVFVREEYADHGRPFGGRNGGELAIQRPQFNVRTGQMERDSSV